MAIFMAGAMMPMAAAAEGGSMTGPVAPTLDQEAVMAGKAVTADLRLRVATDRVDTGALRTANGYVQKRTTGAMLDYYPDGTGRGFHLSAGPRYFTRANYARDAQRRTNGLLYAPDFRITGLRGGYKRYAPAAMMGYTSAIARDVVLGIEGGAMMGAAYTNGPRLPGARIDTSGLNPMAHVMFGLKF